MPAAPTDPAPPSSAPTPADTRWKPSVTVAAVIEQDGRYLLVQERTPEGLRLNNPAGHLDPGESLVDAVVREVLEETARRFTPTALVGIYLARAERPASGEQFTWLRVAFTGSVGEREPGRSLDVPIVDTPWLSAAEIIARAAEHRSPLLAQCVADHAAGRRYPLDLLQVHASLQQPYRLA
ncbi:MAG: NUDIX domain-containing protein [Aquabacterium sp.]